MKEAIIVLYPGVLGEKTKERLKKSWKEVMGDEKIILLEEGLRPVTIEEPLSKREKFALVALPQAMKDQWHMAHDDVVDDENAVARAFKIADLIMQESQKRQQ